MKYIFAGMIFALICGVIVFGQWTMPQQPLRNSGPAPLPSVIRNADGSVTNYFSCLKADDLGRWETVAVGGPVGLDVKGGHFHALPLVMPVDGRCSFAFEASDNRDDLQTAITEAFGTRSMKAAVGDIEFLILPDQQFPNFIRRESFVSVFSSGRKTNGAFDVELPAGYYRLVISNRHAMMMPKYVNFVLGKGPAAPAQIF